MSRSRLFALLLLPCAVGLMVSLARSDDASAGNAVHADATVEALLASMSLEQKVAQMMMSYPPLSKTDPVTVGGVIFVGNLMKSEEGVRQRVADLQSRASVPLLVAADVEGGSYNKLSFLPGLEEVPANRAIQNAEEARAWGRKVGTGMKTLGLNVALAPVLDVAGSGMMWESGRSFGGDPDRVGELGRAYSAGLGEAGVAAIGKHWPGYGSLAENTDHHFVVTERSEADMALHSGAFVAVGGELYGVMLANVGYSSYGGRPAILSKELVKAAHEQGWLTITDDLAIEMLSEATGGDQEEVVRQAFRAGNDILLTTAPIDWDQALDYTGILVAEVRAHPELEAQVDDSVRRILMTKRRLKLL